MSSNKLSKCKTKISVLRHIDSCDDIENIKSILRTLVLSKSTITTDKELHDAFSMNENELLTKKQELAAIISLCIDDVMNERVPLLISNLISEFAQKYIGISILFQTHDTICIKTDDELNDAIYIPPHLDEHFVTLSHPKLLGNDACPFQVTFDVTFPFNPNEENACNRHGGIYFGHTNIRCNRGNGHCSLSEGAICTVIDWNDFKGHDHGFRIYGTETCHWGGFDEWKDIDTNPATKWKIIFEKNNKCIFYADDKKVHSFTCYSNDGCIGFWSFKKCGIYIQNLDIQKI